ncbi:ABC transporter ATP-binding protein [Patescibacteria group bacterium]|nr:ABC transporter ATP-binding protein [Patescibacteria group bacterium]
MKKNQKKLAIKIKNVTKTYVLRHEKPTLIESLLYRPKKGIHTALKDISFSVYEGERLGIIGSNGSGKTTLLKLIAGITKQQKGDIKVNGRVVSLIDLSAGFHPDLTGEENIFLNGLVIGMTRREIEEKKQSIIDFADIGKFIDAPLYTYSGGMELRLGFAIAVHSNPDVLLVDEGFAVGDENFREKAHKKILEFKRQKKTLVMVSHWISELERNCNKFLWLERGEIVKFGGKEVLKKY